MRTIRSIWAWVAIVSLIVAWVPIMGLVRLFDRDPVRYRTGRWFRRLGSVITRANPMWKISISGTMPTDPRHPYLVVGNHQSHADIPVFSRLPWEMKWIGKESLFSLPMLGWMMRISHDIPVDRSSRMSGARALGEAARRLKSNCSVMVMPEGTRSQDGRVGPFSDGAFGLAIKLGVPVLPVAVEGTSNALPKNDWRFGEARNVRLHVFEPIDTSTFSKDQAGELRDHVRQLIIGKVAELRGEDRAGVDGMNDLKQLT